MATIIVTPSGAHREKREEEKRGRERKGKGEEGEEVLPRVYLH